MMSWWQLFDRSEQRNRKRASTNQARQNLGPSQTFCVDGEICHNTALGRWFVSVSDPALKESVMDDGLLSSAKRLKPTRFEGQE